MLCAIHYWNTTYKSKLSLVLKWFSYFVSDEPNALAFQNLRRMCMGKSDCPTTKFCGQRGVSLHVVYHCIEGKVCLSTLMSLTALSFSKYLSPRISLRGQAMGTIAKRSNRKPWNKHGLSHWYYLRTGFVSLS